MFRCNCCNHEFQHPKAAHEDFGMYVGMPAREEYDSCPYCNSDDIVQAEMEDVYGTYIYPGDGYYDLGNDIVHEDNLKQYLSDNEHIV